MNRIALSEIAYARSGDKGDKVNIGVVVRDARLYPALVRGLDPSRIKEWFGELCRGSVRCYELPNLDAVNVVLHQALDGGAARSLRIDNQGKALGDTLLFMEIELSDAEHALVAEAS